ncbi:MAG TPA: COX aromatic rich motif-containing protein [Patescibacteria group bacterium]|nr:COX aromatic rich motif-containing protein [Patescibacteria group bacterium]
MAKHKNQTRPILLPLVGLVALGVCITILIRGADVILFNPKGMIADEQHRLMLVSTLIMLGIAVPTLFLLYFFAWRYREGGKKATVNHRSGNSKFLALLLWAIPTAVMLILASLMLPATQKLEPQKSIESANKALTIQVVALRWKWLFIYPQQEVATVNYVQIPVNTPVQFDLTADETPMNSFWIPHLGGQLYAMTGHENRLNLMASSLGAYEGSAAELSGAGFAGMRFTAHVTSKEDFDRWVGKTKQSDDELNASEYGKLLRPSENNPPSFYKHPDSELYSNILSKYSGSHNHMGY